MQPICCRTMDLMAAAATAGSDFWWGLPLAFAQPHSRCTCLQGYWIAFRSTLKWLPGGRAAALRRETLETVAPGASKSVSLVNFAVTVNLQKRCFRLGFCVTGLLGKLSLPSIRRMYLQAAPDVHFLSILGRRASPGSRLWAAQGSQRRP